MTRTWPAVVVGAVIALAPAAPVSGADPTTIAAGAQLYGDYCSVCHGEQLKNTGSGGTFDLRRLRAADRERFFTAVLNGKSQMPPWRGVLKAVQIESIWAYVLATIDR